MNFTKTINIIFATMAFSFATANEKEDPDQGNLRGNGGKMRNLNPWSSGGRDLLCGHGRVGNGYCPDNESCSKWGYCGTSDAHENNAAPKFLPRSAGDQGPFCGNDEVGNGRCEDGSFCSKHGYCGNSEAHYDQPAPNANLQLLYEAAFMSRMAYFVFANAGKENQRTPNCLDPNKDQLDFCEFSEEGIDAVLITKYRNKCYVSFRGEVPLLTEDSLYYTSEHCDRFDNCVSSEAYLQWNEDVGKIFSSSGESKNNETQCSYKNAYANSYDAVKSFVNEKLPECQASCVGEFGKYGCDVVLTGHSKGGAVAVTAVLDNNSTMKDLYNDPFVVTFGAPAVATRESECKKSINEDKHFRVVTSKTWNNQLKCDPITEHSAINFDIEIGMKEADCVKNVTNSFSDEFGRSSYHMGNAVLLNRESLFDQKYQIAQGFGDVTCTNKNFTNTKHLESSDFANVFIAYEALHGRGEEPLHNIKTYKKRLESIWKGEGLALYPRTGLLLNEAQVSVIDGFAANHICSKDWQCAGNMSTCILGKCQYR